MLIPYSNARFAFGWTDFWLMEKIIGRYIRNVTVKGVDCDELWNFIGKKEKRVEPEDDYNLGIRTLSWPLNGTRSSS